jgi:hypothetical protein
MPTSTKADGLVTTPGNSSCRVRPKAPPMKPPMNSDGANTPPLPPDDTVSEVASILANAIAASRAAPV